MSRGAWITLIVIVLILLLLAYWWYRRKSVSSGATSSSSSSETASSGGGSRIPSQSGERVGSPGGATASTPDAPAQRAGLASESSTSGASAGAAHSEQARSESGGASAGSIPSSPGASATTPAVTPAGVPENLSTNQAEMDDGSALSPSGLNGEELESSGSTSFAEAEAAAVDRAADLAGAADSSEVWQTSSAGLDSDDVASPSDSGETLITPAPPVEAEIAESGNNPPAAYGIAAQPALAAAEEAKAAAATGTPEGQALSDAISQRVYVAAPPAEEASAEESGGAQATDAAGGTASHAGDGYISVDGASDDCPAGYPIKGNASSHIYHRPGESSYAVTIPEICFADEATAVVHGFRPRRSGGSSGSDQQSETGGDGVNIVTTDEMAEKSAAEVTATGSGSASEEASASYGIASNTPQPESASTPPASQSGSGRSRRAPGTGYLSVDGESHDCPSDYPIKGNESSQIFHRPGEASYDRTIPEICFADEATAVSMGFRERRYGGAHNNHQAESASTTSPDASGDSEPNETGYGIAGVAAKASSAATESSDTATSDSGQAGYIEMNGEDRECPEAFPIKGNASSHIFHRPGEPSYDATIPEICFADETVAESMDYRPRKN